MGETQQTADALVDGFKRNDDKAMGSVYLEVFPKVRAHVLRNSGDEDQAKDVFQEAFVACWQNIKEDRFQGGNVSGYLFSIAKNKWTDHLRSPKFKRTVSANSRPHWEMKAEDPMDEEEDSREKDNGKVLQSALARLGQGCRDLLRMFYFERRSMEEISVELGIAASSARNQKYRCMEKLRTLSQEIDGNG